MLLVSVLWFEVSVFNEVSAAAGGIAVSVFKESVVVAPPPVPEPQAANKQIAIAEANLKLLVFITEHFRQQHDKK